MTSPKTIQIFLPDGDPTGIRIAEMTTSIMQLIEFPRVQFSQFCQMPASSQVGIYFLFGQDEETGEELLYIGQSGELKKRLTNHAKKKEFWTKAAVAVSLTQNLTQTHALYLEWLAIQKANEAERYHLHNENSGSKPHVPPPLEADCHEIFSILTTLLGTLGHPVFRKISTYAEDTHSDNVNSTQPEYFYLNRGHAEAKGVMTNEGFLVLAGSKAPYDNTYKYKRRTKHRDALINQGVAKIENGDFILLKDHLFKSPSGAAATIVNMSINGWTDWKNEKGQSLDEVYRTE
ncbi:GIY-YIG nuclease family protein [Galenea microaerophila]